MYKEEIIGSLVVFVACVFAYVGFLEQIEFLPFISSFLAGAFATYVVQHRLQIESENRKIKREDAITMRDKVYGPIFMMMSEILESMEQVERPDWEVASELEKMKTEYFFYNMRQDLKNKVHALAEKLNIYDTFYSSAQTLILRKIREVVKESYKMDISVSLNQVRLHLEKVKDAILVGAITLEQAVLQRTPPNDFVRAKKEVWGEDLILHVRVKGESIELSDFESLYVEVLGEMETDPLFQEEEKQRNILVKELEAFLDEIKAFIIVQ